MNFKKALSAVVLAGTLHFAGCSTVQQGGVVTQNCVIDPLIKGAVCVDARGIDEDPKPWETMGNYVCRSPDEDKKLQEAAARCKK